MGDIVPERLQPQSVAQSVASSTNPASKAIDNDLSTFSLASVSNGDIWYKVEFEKDKNVFIYVVQVSSILVPHKHRFFSFHSYSFRSIKNFFSI